MDDVQRGQTVVRRIGQPPGYPVQLVLGVFDVPATAGPGAVAGTRLIMSHGSGRSEF